MFTAYLLARQGLKVRVYERSPRLDPALRTLIVTDQMRDLLGTMGEPALRNEIRRFELFTDGRAATVTLRRPDLVIERSQLIRALAHGARQAGADVVLGRKFSAFGEKGGELRLAFERTTEAGAEEVRATTVVGADGAASRVAREAGWPQPITVPLVQALVPLPKDMAADSTRVWFVPQDTPYFYWLIPESSTLGALGLIGEDGRETRLALERFLERQHLKPLAFQAAKIPLYTEWVPVRRQLGGGDVYLVGDAAAHVKPTTVGGIVTGFRGALAVAEAIMNGGHSRRLGALRRELNLHLLIRKIIHNFSQAHYSKLIDLLNAPARRDLETYGRDEPRTVLWHLCLHQPRLLLMGVRALLTGGAFLRQSAG